MLFTSDENLRRMQQNAGRIPKGVELSAAEKRHESMEADREMREHQRVRELAFLLIVVPLIVGVVLAVVPWLVALLRAA